MTIESPGSRFFLGLDLGQAHDYSAIAIAERRVELTGTHDPVTFVRHTRTRVIVRLLERISLRTPYPDVVARVAALTRPFDRKTFQIILDATGVGAPVRDMLEKAGLGVKIYGVTLTGGERVTLAWGGYHVPRHDLLSNLRILIEKRMLEVIVSGPVAEALRSEFHAWGRRSAHDDLIFAVALACWKAAGQTISLYGSGPLPFIHPEVRR